MKGRADSPSVPRTLGDHEDRISTLEFAITARSGAGRVLAGALQNDAVIIEGSGFTAEWNDEDGSSPFANLYTIRFDSPFSEPGPVVSLTPNNNNPAGTEGEYGVSLKRRNTDYIVVETKEFDGTARDGGFDFLCAEAS